MRGKAVLQNGEERLHFKDVGVVEPTNLCVHNGGRHLMSPLTTGKTKRSFRRKLTHKLNSRLGENFCRPLLASSSHPYLGFLWKANKPAGTLADVVVIESSKSFYLLFFFLRTNKVLGGFFGQVDYKSMSNDVRFRRMSCNNINPINMNKK